MAGKNLFLNIKEFFSERKKLKVTGGATKISPLKAFYMMRLKKAEKSGNVLRQEKLKSKIEKLETVKNNVLVKYICRELLMFFLVFFLIFFAIFFVNQLLLVIETLLKKHVPFMLAVRLIIYYMPEIVSQAAPFATLVGFLVCLGRMVTDNEILIFRASGLRYIKIFFPVIVMGVIISIFSFVMNDYFLPLGRQESQKLYKKIATSNPAVELEPNSVKWMGDTAIIIGDVDETHLSDIIILDMSSSSKPKIIVAGESDVHKSVSPGVLMQLVMSNATVLMLDTNKKQNYDVLESQEASLNIFEDEVEGLGGSISPREMTSFELYKRVKKMSKNNGMRTSYMIEFNRKYSVPFASIFFALLAFPLALVFGRKDGQTLGLIFGVVLSVLYWAATLLGQMIALKQDGFTFFCTWSPNIVLGALGLILYLRLRKK